MVIENDERGIGPAENRIGTADYRDGSPRDQRGRATPSGAGNIDAALEIR